MYVRRMGLLVGRWIRVERSVLWRVVDGSIVIDVRYLLAVWRED